MKLVLVFDSIMMRLIVLDFMRYVAELEENIRVKLLKEGLLISHIEEIGVC